jgi:hypothetical protein
LKTALVAVSLLLFGSGLSFAGNVSGDQPSGDVGSDKAVATDESAKMGKEEGTHTGTNQGVTPENDTKKVEQPARKNVPSNESPQQ